MASQDNCWLSKEILKIVCMKVSGLMVKKMDVEFRYGLMGQGMMDSGETVLIMDMEGYAII